MARALIYSLMIVMLALASVVRQPSAVNAVDRFQPKKVVTVEVTIGKRSKLLNKYGVPIVLDPPGRKFIEDQFVGGTHGFAESCPNDIGCSYDIFLIADAVDENSSRVTAVLSFRDRKQCNTRKQFLVIKGKSTELRMKCGNEIKAYYPMNQ